MAYASKMAVVTVVTMKNMRQNSRGDAKRRWALRWRLATLAAALVALCPAMLMAATADTDVDRVVSRGLDWLASHQSRLGHWTAGGDVYPTPMTALAGMAMLCEGSTTTQGKYAPNIRNAVTYLVGRSRGNGLIGDPARDDRYTYGHGFAMLFLSQVLGEEEDAERREELIRVLTKAVEFTGRAQTDSGGWGYVSAKDGGGFDEGSTTITQVQGLRGCRNAGIPVPKEIIDKAVKYIKKCTGPDGGVRYSLSQGMGGGGRPPITAAAIACLFNAGDYDSQYVPKILKYCHQNLDNNANQFGHWQYANYYYSQVLYRQGGKEWETYRNRIFPKLVREAASDGSWNQEIGPVFSTSVNLTILQLPKGVLPIYQR
ncbi:MAG: prenyltransferase/squalene oxidase repeat-containing protein [Thermoguttaceae bacterium]